MTDDETPVAAFPDAPEDVPAELRERPQWLMFDESHDPPRQPHWRGDFSVSWSDPDDWHTFAEAYEAASERPEWGIGYLLARGNDDYPRGLYGGLDLDGCLIKRENGRYAPKDWLPSLKPFIDRGAYIEVSAGGWGLHIPQAGFEPPEWWHDVHFSDEEHEGVEAFGSKFYAVTGDVLNGEVLGDEPTVVDDGTYVEEWLRDAYEAITDERPPDESEPEIPDAATGGSGSGRVNVTVRDVARSAPERGEYGEHPVHGSGTGSNFKTDSDGETFRCWRHETTGSALHLLGVDEGIIDCGEWDRGGLGTDTWREIFDAARERGLDVPEPEAQSDTPEPPEGMATPERTDGGAAAAPAGGGGSTAANDASEKWAYVRDLFAATEQGTSGQAKNHAARQLAQDLHPMTDDNSGALYIYDSDKGVYVGNGENRIKELLIRDDRLGFEFMPKRADDIISMAKSLSFTPTDEIGGGRGVLGVANGTLVWDDPGDDPTLREHRAADNLLTQLPAEYDPDAECPRWRAFVEDMVEEDRRDTVQEYVGYCLTANELPKHTALMLVGTGANGKTQFLDVVRELLGRENIVSESLQNISHNDHAKARLYRKLANINGDLSEASLQRNNSFKEIVGGERMSARRLYQNAFEFEPTAKHIYSANKVPEVHTDDDGFFRRWIIAEFPRTVPEDDRTDNLGEKIADDELSGILNWALEGRRRLFEQDTFTGVGDAADRRARWQHWGGSLNQFISECLTDAGEYDKLPAGVVYEHYRTFVASELDDEAAEAQSTLTSEIQSVMPGVKYSKSLRIDGKQQRGFKRLKLTEEWVDKLNDGAISQQRRAEILRDSIQKQDKSAGKGAYRDEVLDEAERRGLDRGMAEGELDRLTDEKHNSFVKVPGGGYRID